VIPLDDARAQILAAIEPLPPRVHATTHARGLVLGEDVIAGEAVPPFANTGMDGYAVRAADTQPPPARLRVVDELAAGQAPSRAVGPGEAIRIMTGAPMPDGADAVVMVEMTRTEGDHVVIERAAAPGDHVRPAGGDLARGDAVFTAGTVLAPAHIGVLASLGIAQVRCHPRPRVAVMSTGDELVESGPLALGRIRDSNRPMLLAVVEESGFEAVDYGIARDDKDVMAERITAAVDECDALLTSGAVSMGDFDYVKVVLEELTTARPDSAFAWMQVAIKPAKPLAFARFGRDGEAAGGEPSARPTGRRASVPVFGLPGNPVSSRVSFELFARPALRRLMGRRDLSQPVVRAVAGSAFTRRADGKLHLDRVRLEVRDGRYVCERAGFQASNVLSGMAAATGLAMIPDGPGVEAGDEVEVLVLGP
jgi:molybdenum cofactor synthesis domain-containing protein